MSNKTGGRAFPCDSIVERDEVGHLHGFEVSSGGMTLRDYFAAKAMQGIMTITHNGKQYTAKKLNDNEWQLTSVSAPRDKLTLNRWQMHIAGLLKQVEVKV